MDSFFWCVGGGLLSGHESDYSPITHLHERRGCFLGAGQTAVGTETLYARYTLTCSLPNTVVQEPKVKMTCIVQNR